LDRYRNSRTDTSGFGAGITWKKGGGGKEGEVSSEDNLKATGPSAGNLGGEGILFFPM